MDPEDVLLLCPIVQDDEEDEALLLRLLLAWLAPPHRGAKVKTE